jgi:hypothetical protein
MLTGGQTSSHPSDQTRVAALDRAHTSQYLLAMPSGIAAKIAWDPSKQVAFEVLSPRPTSAAHVRTLETSADLLVRIRHRT